MTSLNEPRVAVTPRPTWALRFRLLLFPKSDDHSKKVRGPRGAPFTRPMRQGPGFGGAGPFRLPTRGPDGQLEIHRPNCLCCIGPPDHAFERSCAAVVALSIDGVGPAEAEKFVRLCTVAGGGDATRLSKGKAKAACRSVRSKASGLPPLDLAEVESMQRAVLDCYGVSERVPTVEESSEAAGDEARVE